MTQVFFGRPEDPALLRALRVAGSVVLLLLLAAALTRLLVLVGLLPEWLPFSWSGFGEELLVKRAGTFIVVLFLHLLRRRIREMADVGAVNTPFGGCMGAEGKP